MYNNEMVCYKNIATSKGKIEIIDETIDKACLE